jgi:hypothetical protein
MPKNISSVKKVIFEFMREASAIIHYFSDVVVGISLYNLIFEHGAVSKVITWLIIALISGIISEFLKSHLPTPFRVFSLRRKGI